MTNQDKEMMINSYMDEIRVNALRSNTDSSLGYLKGYKKAFSLYKRISEYWMYTALFGFTYMLVDLIRYVC
tara:strand:- start:81 stop:293 length:213 start_codon:yes stop_codon:yes gene_type:complete